MHEDQPSLNYPTRVKTLSISNVAAPRRVKRENVSFPVAVRRSKTPLLIVHLDAQ